MAAKARAWVPILVGVLAVASCRALLGLDDLRMVEPAGGGGQAGSGGVTGGAGGGGQAGTGGVEGGSGGSAA